LKLKPVDDKSSALGRFSRRTSSQIVGTGEFQGFLSRKSGGMGRR
jgi:hypothetical protein